MAIPETNLISLSDSTSESDSFSPDEQEPVSDSCSASYSLSEASSRYVIVDASKSVSGLRHLFRNILFLLKKIRFGLIPVNRKHMTSPGQIPKYLNWLLGLLSFNITILTSNKLAIRALVEMTQSFDRCQWGIRHDSLQQNYLPSFSNLSQKHPAPSVVDLLRRNDLSILLDVISITE